jgi:PAS domain S-box-containing protein
MQTNQNNIVYTMTARCRDCYRCLKYCPVKAIRLVDSQAYVDGDKCINCGTCIKECPQNAKVYRKDLETVRSFLNNGDKVAASIAPSFAGIYDNSMIRRLVAGLRKIGFTYVAETSVCAYDVGQLVRGYLADGQNNGLKICTACPAVVNYIEKYQGELAEHLIPITSPMIAHAKKIKRDRGTDFKVVFIGPCVAKKGELTRHDNAGYVDAAITFGELEELCRSYQLDLLACDESDFDEESAGNSKLFPIPGGLLKTGGIDEQDGKYSIFAVSSFEDIREIFKFGIENRNENILIEPLFCREGCINGPGIDNGTNLFLRKKMLLEYHQNNKKEGKPEIFQFKRLEAEYTSANQLKPNKYSEEEIEKVLLATGKADDESQLNCGSCGYLTCREKAIAVLDGMAETEMCLPYMRKLAEQRTDKIIETSPNGIIILDNNFNIIAMNPSFMELFRCTKKEMGRHISVLMDPAYFEKIASGVYDKLERTNYYPQMSVICQEFYYALRKEQQYVGIFIDITNIENNMDKLKNIRKQTVLKAKELLEHQIEMGQKIAQFLGENMARSEELVDNLMDLTGSDHDK